MANNSYFYPIYIVRIGNKYFRDGVIFDVYSSKDTYYDWCKIKFSDKIIEKFSFNSMEEVEISIGYSDALDKHDTIFTGYIKESINIGGADENNIICKDEMVRLEAIEIYNTFVNVSFNEVLQFAMKKANITNFKISNINTRQLPLLVVTKKNILNFIKFAELQFDVKNDFFFSPDKTFYYGIKPAQEKIYTLSYGENISEARYQDGYWIIKTILLTELRPTNMININHPKINGQYEINKIHYFSDESSFLRTEIYIKS